MINLPSLPDTEYTLGSEWVSSMEAWDASAMEDYARLAVEQNTAELRAEVEMLREELARLTKLPFPLPLWGNGCPVCGLGAGGTATAYVCQRGDCPTRVTCGETK